MTSRIKPESIEFWIIELLSEGKTRTEAIEFFTKELRRNAIDRSDFESAQKQINDRFPLEEWEINLRNLIRVSHARNYKKAWVFFNFLELYPQPTKAQLNAIAVSLGFTKKWLQTIAKTKNQT